MLRVICMVSLLGSISLVTSSHVRGAPEWDVLIFTQHWPMTVCHIWKERNHSHTCSLPSDPDEWTIHGIWPTKFGELGPSFCNRTWLFDPEEIKPIEENLVNYWRNIEAETDHYSLWAHEWNKHGTCAAALPPLDSQLRYFQQGLNWLKDFMMNTVLESAGITPSNDREYSLTDINRAIKMRLGVNPVIECKLEHHRNYLFELRVCFDKNLKFANCDGVVSDAARATVHGESILTNCDTSKNVFYPRDLSAPERPKWIYVNALRFVTWLQWLTL